MQIELTHRPDTKIAATLRVSACLLGLVLTKEVVTAKAMRALGPLITVSSPRRRLPVVVTFFQVSEKSTGPPVYMRWGFRNTILHFAFYPVIFQIVDALNFVDSGVP